MLTTVGAAPSAGWYRDPVDDRAARFFDGDRWTQKSQPGASRLLGRPEQGRPRATLTRQELMHRRRLSAMPFIGQFIDLYL